MLLQFSLMKHFGLIDVNQTAFEYDAFSDFYTLAYIIKENTLVLKQVTYFDNQKANSLKQNKSCSMLSQISFKAKNL